MGETQTVAVLHAVRDLRMQQRPVPVAILHSVKAPEHLFTRPYLRPVFDDPEFVVRNVWRFYGGWYGGDPATLKPAPDAQVAREMAALAGGAMRMADRALALAAAGDLRLAGHLAQTAGLAAPGDAEVQAARQAVFAQRAGEERSSMARAMFSWAASQSVVQPSPGQPDQA